MLSTAEASVVINEVELNPTHGQSEWVELYNAGSNTVDISGWTAIITDGAWTGRMAVPAGTIIPSKGFYVISGSPSWNNNGGFVTLYDNSKKKLDQTQYRQGGLGNDLTWGLYPDGNLEGGLMLMGETRGRPNML